VSLILRKSCLLLGAGPDVIFLVRTKLCLVTGLNSRFSTISSIGSSKAFMMYIFRPSRSFLPLKEFYRALPKLNQPKSKVQIKLRFLALVDKEGRPSGPSQILTTLNWTLMSSLPRAKCRLISSSEAMSEC
jgi:hypothetical protein